jgi:glycopeptide antibiotics resistance protein
MPFVFNIGLLLISGLVWLGIAAFLFLERKNDLLYLFFFTIFFIYIVKVLDYTVIQFQMLILLKYFMPNLMLQGVATGESINLIPLITLSGEGIKTSLLNVLLFVPFGFGLPFVKRISLKKIILAGALFSICIELLQFVTGHFAQTTFRIADINDVLFNTLGSFLGGVLCIVFVLLYRKAVLKWRLKDPFSRYINERVIL